MRSMEVDECGFGGGREGEGFVCAVGGYVKARRGGVGRRGWRLCQMMRVGFENRMVMKRGFAGS